MNNENIFMRLSWFVQYQGCTFSRETQQFMFLQKTKQWELVLGAVFFFSFGWISQCFWKKRITNRFWIPVNFPKLLYRKLKLSGLSNISCYMDKISTFPAYLFGRGTHEKVTLVKLAPESDFRLWHLEAESGKRIGSVHPKPTYSPI